MTHTSVIGNAIKSDQKIYIYDTPKGFKIHCHIVEDCGLVKDAQGREWHKVIVRPIGLNNTIPMTLNMDSLREAQ